MPNNRYNQKVYTSPDTPRGSDNSSVNIRRIRYADVLLMAAEAAFRTGREDEARKAMVAYKSGEKFTLDSHSRLHEAIEQYLFEERRDVLRLVTSAARPDDQAQQKISAVQERLVQEYGYDKHSAKEALNYVTTLLSQE